MFSKIFILRFKDIETIGSFSASEVGSVGSFLFGKTERISFSSKSSVVKFTFYYFIIWINKELEKEVGYIDDDNVFFIANKIDNILLQR